MIVSNDKTDKHRREIDTKLPELMERKYLYNLFEGAEVKEDDFLQALLPLLKCKSSIDWERVTINQRLTYVSNIQIYMISTLWLSDEYSWEFLEIIMNLESEEQVKAALKVLMHTIKYLKFKKLSL